LPYSPLSYSLSPSSMKLCEASALFQVSALSMYADCLSSCSGGPTTITNLPLATAVITILFLLATYIPFLHCTSLSSNRTSYSNSFILELVIRSGLTSLVAIELPRIGILWVLWLASGANFYSVVRLSASLCAEFSSIIPDRECFSSHTVLR
jgi:hypothetical protein